MEYLILRTDMLRKIKENVDSNILNMSDTLNEMLKEDRDISSTDYNTILKETENQIKNLDIPKHVIKFGDFFIIYIKQQYYCGIMKIVVLGCIDTEKVIEDLNPDDIFEILQLLDFKTSDRSSVLVSATSDSSVIFIFPDDGNWEKHKFFNKIKNTIDNKRKQKYEKSGAKNSVTDFMKQCEEYEKQIPVDELQRIFKYANDNRVVIPRLEEEIEPEFLNRVNSKSNTIEFDGFEISFYIEEYPNCHHIKHIMVIDSTGQGRVNASLLRSLCGYFQMSQQFFDLFMLELENNTAHILYPDDGNWDNFKVLKHAKDILHKQIKDKIDEITKVFDGDTNKGDHH